MLLAGSRSTIEAIGSGLAPGAAVTGTLLAGKNWRRYRTFMANALGYENDDFRAWVDGDSIQIKSVTGDGDPGDFGSDEVRPIIAALTRMVEHIDGVAR
jgi:hypothetical protein